MLTEEVFQFTDLLQFKKSGLTWANSFEVCSYFDSNNYSDPYSNFDVLITAGARFELACKEGSAFDELKSFLTAHQGSFIPGYFSYDLKNEVEVLLSENPDHVGFDDLFFFVPQHVVMIRAGEAHIISENPAAAFAQIQSAEPAEPSTTALNIPVQHRVDRQIYIETLEKLRGHIKRGDIYEINFCQEFFANASIEPLDVFTRLNAESPSPFSAYFKNRDHYILSATPERFLSKRGSKLISQPIKGTAGRGETQEVDESQKRLLRNSEKERSENVMIVDLVRNDLTRSAVPGTVRVEELFGVYTFSQVHQLISTVVCEKDPNISNVEVLKNTFPMGSMTGAPKIRAMQLADSYESSRRGAYSGSLGYFSPSGDFDFNVIIRSILYNKSRRYVSFHTGGAITIESDPEKEYEECLLKAKAIMRVLAPDVYRPL